MNELIHSQILKAETQNHHTSHSPRNLMIDKIGEHRINMNERFTENKMNGNSSNFVRTNPNQLIVKSLMTTLIHFINNIYFELLICFNIIT